MDRWPSIDERGAHCVVMELELVLDWKVAAAGAAVGEHVGADLRQRDLEVQDAAVVEASAGRLTEVPNGFMKRLQSFIEMAEGGVELKSAVGLPMVRSQ